MRPFALAAFCLLAASLASSQQLEVPVIDLPYHVQRGLRGPSMQQSLAMTGATYELSHICGKKPTVNREQRHVS